MTYEKMFALLVETAKNVADRESPEAVVAKETQHVYIRAGIPCAGYGPSMDPHYCNDPEEPCITLERKTTLVRDKWRHVKTNGKEVRDDS